MQMCKSHWKELRNAIDDRGLSSFVSKSAEEFDRKAKCSSGRMDTRSGFDPLASSYIALLNNCVEAGGIEISTIPGCPLCELIDHCGCGKGDACDFRNWIGYAADEQVDIAKKLGVLGDG